MVPDSRISIFYERDFSDLFKNSKETACSVLEHMVEKGFHLTEEENITRKGIDVLDECAIPDCIHSANEARGFNYKIGFDNKNNGKVMKLTMDLDDPDEEVLTRATNLVNLVTEYKNPGEKISASSSWNLKAKFLKRMPEGDYSNESRVYNDLMCYLTESGFDVEIDPGFELGNFKSVQYIKGKLLCDAYFSGGGLMVNVSAENPSGEEMKEAAEFIGSLVDYEPSGHELSEDEE